MPRSFTPSLVVDPRAAILRYRGLRLGKDEIPDGERLGGSLALPRGERLDGSQPFLKDVTP